MYVAVPMRRFAISSLLIAFLLGLGVQARAQPAACTADDFAAAVDRSGESLRKFNSEELPKLQSKLQELKAAKGWDDLDYEQKGLNSVRDARTRRLDEQAEELIVKIDSLGRTPEGAAPDCSKLSELDAASLELLAVMKAKSKHILARLDAAIAGGQTKTAAAPATEAPAQPPDATPPPPAPKSSVQAWNTQTRDQAVPPPPPPQAILPPPGAEQDQGYTIEEIREITRGFFGTISTELGSVLEYAFSISGRPDGYVLGSEGGGAFLAGVRYGSGTLYLRSGGKQKVYWHGPSIGTDLGAAGSRTMFLIYRLHEPDQLFRQFTGIDGSAYFVGGVGITFLKGGRVLMAPIRSGLGFRLGANIGYIRFTPSPTWNPF